jgi:hypothetical protein
MSILFLFLLLLLLLLLLYKKNIEVMIFFIDSDENGLVAQLVGIVGFNNFVF